MEGFGGVCFRRRDLRSDTRPVWGKNQVFFASLGRKSEGPGNGLRKC